MFLRQDIIWNQIIHTMYSNVEHSYCRTVLPIKILSIYNIFIHTYKNNGNDLTKFRCGVALLKIETRRYTRTPEEERLCTLCNNIQEVESEEHCLIRCELYPDIRQILFHNAFLRNPYFDHFNDTDKLCFILSNEKMIPNTAKACHNILTKRSAITYHCWKIDVLVIWHLNMYYKVTMWFYTAI